MLHRIPLASSSANPIREASAADNGERHYSFSFTSRDDATVVYSWYQARLEALAFRVTVDVAPRSAGRLTSSASDDGRALSMRNFPTVPENTFTVEITDR